ncbi:alkaline phosphatase [Palleronia aestuarii]|nr:alkaline phosphatase [Palleronia aestuarii]
MSRRTLLATSVTAFILPVASDAATLGGAKNVMMFVSDGASWGTWDMASYYEHGETGRQAYDAFDTKLGMTTGSASTEQPYDPEAAWNGTPTGDEDRFEGYTRIKQGASDSAAAGTALATGTKTLNGRINVGPDGEKLPFLSQAMKTAGKKAGVVSSVPFSHATPAAFGAQNIDRNNYLEIAGQMINEGTLDVIMGGGNPNYDGSGQRLDEANYNRISEADWEALNGADAPMTLIETREAFEALADGSRKIDDRVIGLPRVGDTLQVNRDPEVVGSDPDNPTGVAFVDGVPTLETMTRGALRQLGDDEDGLFLMVEGGAVDWAAHANSTAGIIEEQMDFNAAVEAGVDWVEAESSWDETLMLVLTDHGNGMPMGPNSDEIAFQPIENNGEGVLPGVMWHTGGHTTENTLFWAHGVGSDLFADEIAGNDPFLASILEFNDGAFFDNTAVAGVVSAAAGITDPAPVPVPASFWLLAPAFGLLGGIRRLKKRQN